MCFTGNFALAMMTEPSVVAPVLSQPSLPLPIGPEAARGRDRRRRPPRSPAPSGDPDDKDSPCSACGSRADSCVPAGRFDHRCEFGDRFEAIELEDEDARKSERPPHSVLTIHLKEEGRSKRRSSASSRSSKERTA